MLGIKEILGDEIAAANEENLRKLKERVHANKVSWVLGAGVSKSVGVPLWGECLQKMWTRMLMLDKSADSKECIIRKNDAYQNALKEIKCADKEDKNATECFFTKVNQTILGEKWNEVFDRIDNLEAAEYIKNFVNIIVKENESMSPARQKEMAEQIYFNLLKDSLSIDVKDPEMLDKLRKGTLGVLSRYFVTNADKTKFVVINYNFDDLLEFNLLKMGLAQEKCHVKLPGTPMVLDAENGVHIYHPHGVTAIATDSFIEENLRLVLAEGDYEKLEKKAYIWENSVQAKALHDTSCIFLGFSGEDYNFRRIIKNMESGEERQENVHYMFISIESFVKKMFENEVHRRLLENISRTEDKRTEFLKKVKSKKYEEKYDEKLREVLLDKNMKFEKMMMIRRLYAQYLYWSDRNIIPIWTTRDELTTMITGILEKV